MTRSRTSSRARTSLWASTSSRTSWSRSGSIGSCSSPNPLAPVGDSRGSSGSARGDGRRCLWALSCSSWREAGRAGASTFARVRKAGNRVRITAQLVDATTGYHLWAERYDRDLKDVFAVQDEVSQKIVGVLAVKLTLPEKDRLARTPTRNLEAYDYVLRGMEYQRRTTKEANAEARKMFGRAVELDPDYAMAYAALGWSHLQAWQFQWSRDAETLQRAFELARKAVARA